MSTNKPLWQWMQHAAAKAGSTEPDPAACAAMLQEIAFFIPSGLGGPGDVALWLHKEAKKAKAEVLPIEAR